MSTKNHLKRMADILWNHYDDEIRQNRDWYWATKNWEFNFVCDPDWENITAYRRKGCVTDWSDYIVLEDRVKVWKEIV